MLVHGFPTPLGQEWARISKNSSAATFVTTAIGAASKVGLPTTGIQITLLPNQAVRIRRYTSTVQESGVFDNFLFATGGEFNIQKSPFGQGNGIVVYPAMSEISVPIDAPVSVPVGQQIGASAVVFTLIEDWFEFDDTATDVYFGTLQLQTIWTVLNQTGVGKSAIVAERATWDIYELRKPGLVPAATKVVIVNQGSLRGDP